MSTETLSRSDFDARREDGELSIALVGMSNVGKSHWSGRLADEAGFDRIDVDKLIEQELLTELQRAGYTGGIADVARWMGQPYEPQSPTNQQTYLDFETAIMCQILDRLAKSPLNGNIVVDTTGSVVHINENAKRRLKLLSTVVYLEATDAMRQDMFEKYIQEPKPVVWGRVFCQKSDETPEQALARAYPELLERRSKLYRSMAHVVVPHEVSLEISGPNELLSYVRDMLPLAYANSTIYTPKS